ncbi:hypothetical protein [Pseudomaricurvus sp. HS19]|uniref:hypothetical protein n=1 Tax=Pseudomaricurvus sp. HS19 TaxID=2692626 RepID=UPI001370B1EA|nr:hypothetical protein [Pseudomaricurvus sp. HS19]MYM63997.1 hypothetical protein [Pseudomaricurvus sp. HS19]
MKPVNQYGLQAVVCALLLGLLTACDAKQEEKEDGSLTMNVSETSVRVEGVPGGSTTMTAKLSATVTAIDYEQRTVTLEDREGHQKTVSIGPEAVNFEQVEVGDHVEISYKQETVIYLNPIDAPTADGAAAVAIDAPEGSKPASSMTAVAEVTAVVTAVDLEKHTVTLQFPDGEVQTVPVRKDVELREDQVGREVVIQVSTAMAISVTKL